MALNLHLTPPPPDDGTATVSGPRMAILFLIMLTTAAGNTAMQSVMPSIGTKLGVADFWVMLAYSWSALLWMLTAPYWARMSDKRGRKALMRLGLWGFIASFSLCAMALWFGLHGYWGPLVTMLVFALFRSLYGTFGSAAPPAVQAYVAARTGRADRTKALSVVASSFGLGTVIGPAVAPLLILPGLGLLTPFAAFAAFGVVVLIALRVGLPDDDPRFGVKGQIIAEPMGASTSQTMFEDEDEPSPENAVRLRWRSPQLWPWVLTGLLGGHAQAIIMGIVGFLTLDRLGLRDAPDLGAGPIGTVLMSGAFATLLAQWGLIPLLHIGPRRAVLWGGALGAFGCAIVGIAGDLHSIALGYAVASLGFGLFRPGFTSGASLAVSRAEQGQVAGMVASVAGAAFIVAPAIGVFIYGWNEAVAFCAIIALCLAMLVWAWRKLPADT